MSILYNQYLKLKQENNKNIILFKNGMFYIALESDAITLSKLLYLKLTNFGNSTQKCGFPENRLPHYTSILKNSNIEYTIILPNTSKIKKTTAKSLNSTSPPNINQQNSTEKANYYSSQYEILLEFSKIDFYTLNLKGAFDILYDLQVKVKKVLEETNGKYI